MAEDITKIIHDLIKNKLSDINIEIVEIELKKEDNAQMLSVFIDTPNGVTLDICTDASKIIKSVLDEREDEIDYDFLEVSSPGVDRIIKTDIEFKRFLGSRVKLKTYQLLDGKKNFVGTLNSFSNESIDIKIDSNVLSIPRDSIAQIRLHP